MGYEAWYDGLLDLGGRPELAPEIVPEDNGVLDGDPNGCSSGEPLDWDCNDPLPGQRTTVGEPDPAGVKTPYNGSYPTAKPPYAGNDGESGGEGRTTGSYDPSKDAPTQEPYLENPAQEALAAVAPFYGGVYVDGQGVVHVLLTEDTPENRAAVRRAAPLPDGDGVSFDKADYTRAYLEELLQKISAAMESGELSSASSAGIYDDLNRVKVTVTTDDGSELAKLYALDTLGGALIVERADGAAAQNYPTLEGLAP